MLERAYQHRVWLIIIFPFAVILGFLNLKFKPSLSSDPMFWFALMFFSVFIIISLFSYIFDRIEIHTTKLVSRTGNIKFYYHELPWDEVTWLEDDHFWPIYATHVHAYNEADLRRRIKELGKKEVAGLNTQREIQEFNNELKEIRKLRRGKESVIFFLNLTMKGYKDFNREVIFRSPPDTVVPYSLLKRVGLTQSDIGKLYKQQEPR